MAGSTELLPGRDNGDWISARLVNYEDLEFPNDFTAPQRSEGLIENSINILAHESDMTIAHDEMRPTDVMAAEVIEVGRRMVRSVVETTKDTLTGFFSPCDHPRPGRPPAEIHARLAFTHEAGAAGSIGKVSEPDQTVMVNCAVADTLTSSCHGGGPGSVLTIIERHRSE